MGQRECVVEAKTIDEAIQQGLSQLQLPLEQVEIEILQHPKILLGKVRALARVQMREKDTKEENALPEASAKEQKPETPVKEMVSRVAADDAVVSIEQGALRYTPPKGEGSVGAVVIDRNILAHYEGIPVRGRVELSKGTRPLEVRLPDSREPKVQLKMKVIKRGLEAIAQWKLTKGVTFALKDHPPGETITLALQAQEILPPRMTREQIFEEAKRVGIVHGISVEGISAAELLEDEGSVMIARGTPPVQPVPGNIEYLFEKQKEEDNLEETGKVDHFEKKSILNVEIGEVLAERLPPIPGKPGKSVLGEELPPAAAKPVEFKVGEGVQLTPDGLKAVASTAGMPVVQGGILKMLAVYELSGDADISTGHIRFKGEIIVRGNVAEKIQIQSYSGGITIGGMVSSATLTAETHVVVEKNVIGSQIRAGGMSVISLRLFSLINAINSSVSLVLRAFAVVRIQVQDSDGKLFKNLLELKYTSIPRTVRELQEYFARVSNLLDPEFTELVNQLAATFLGRGPLEIKSIDEVHSLLAETKNWESLLKEKAEQKADIRVRYLQQSELECSGSVSITGQGSYYSQIVCGTGFSMERGVFRGGSLSVDQGNIVAKEFGGPTGVSTEVTLVRTGRMTINKVYPNVVTSIQNKKFKFDSEYSNVKVFLQDGVLKVFSGTLELN